MWKSIQVQPCPILQQFVTQTLMDRLIISMCPCHGYTPPESWLEDLAPSESNALRYACGYIVKRAREKIASGSHSLKQSLLFGLDMMEVEDEGECESGERVNAIDRGGLTHINNSTYRFFYAIEMEVRN